MNQKIDISTLFDNPQLSLDISDIDLSRPFDRGIEPMQYQAIGFKQKFPWFGKLEAKKGVSLARRAILLDSYNEARVELALQVRLAYYSIVSIKKQIYILGRYKRLLAKSISLYSSYLSVDKDSHNSRMVDSLSLSNTKIEIERYKSLLKAYKSRLSYLTKSKSKVSAKIRVKSPKSLRHYISRLHHNPSYQKMKSKVKKANANKRVEDLSIYPDPYLKVGYFNRQRFNDYLSIGVGVSLPIYGKERLKSQIAQKELLASKSDELDFRDILKRDISIEYAKLKEAYKIYKILTNESLPKLKHIFELSQASIQNGGDIVSYINLLSQKSRLEAGIVSIRLRYIESKLRLNALIGEI